MSCVAVYSGQPNSASDDIEAVTIVGSFQDKANHINQKEIQWGVRLFPKAFFTLFLLEEYLIPPSGEDIIFA